MIRPAEDRDSAFISDIWSPVIRDTLSTFNSIEPAASDIQSMLRAKRAQDHAFLVALHEGRLAGFACYGQFRNGVGYARCMEHTIILAEEARGLGLGRQLLGALEHHARERSIHAMMAGVSAANATGVRFHAAMGYLEVARLPQVGFKNGALLDLVLMQKFL
ncbi:N-acetyltransferase family protein [Brevirhabdus sp.]|uniref:N-acetyltransferase family protein n=1 Tax=Brevirhabdus sp. TaxID=2004514 RepID=UPI00405A2E95